MLLHFVDWPLINSHRLRFGSGTLVIIMCNHFVSFGDMNVTCYYTKCGKKFDMKNTIPKWAITLPRRRFSLYFRRKIGSSHANDFLPKTQIHRWNISSMFFFNILTYQLSGPSVFAFPTSTVLTVWAFAVRSLFFLFFYLLWE